MVDSESVSQTQKILESVVHTTDSLGISRVPAQLKADFTALAKEEFCNDYGMTLRHIWDQFIEYQMLKSRIISGEYRVQVIAPEQVTEKESGIKLCDGSVKKSMFQKK